MVYTTIHLYQHIIKAVETTVISAGACRRIKRQSTDRAFPQGLFFWASKAFESYGMPTDKNVTCKNASENPFAIPLSKIWEK